MSLDKVLDRVQSFLEHCWDIPLVDCDGHCVRPIYDGGGPTCVTLCPMDIDLVAYIRDGTRILSTECMLCQTCVTVCARDALRVSAGLDRGGRERVRVRTEEAA